MSAEDGQEKSFEPTPSRIERARREGDVAISRDATGAAAYIGFYLAIAAGIVTLAPAIANALATFLDRPEEFAPSNGAARLFGAVMIALAPAGVFLAIPAAMAAVALALQQSVVFAPARLKIKPSRLSPFANAKRKFGPEGLVEFLKGVTLLALLAAGFFTIYAGRYEALPGSARMSGQQVGGAIAAEGAMLVGAVAIFTLFVGLADLLWVRARLRKRLMMSLEEVRRDSKETEGDPHFKSARRERAKAIATNKMLMDVPKATVVVVNPEHYAVALKWDGPKSSPPTCVAKGVDEMARKIREIAALNGVPLRHDPPVARAIFATVEVGEEIRREHFAAIAAAIHYADTIRKKAKTPWPKMQ